MKPNPAQVAIIQQVTGCTANKAAQAVRRLAWYAATLPANEDTARFDLSTQAAATLCGVTKHTFLKYATDHPAELPFLKMGIKFLFRRADVQAFINRRIQGGQ